MEDFGAAARRLLAKIDERSARMGKAAGRLQGPADIQMLGTAAPGVGSAETYMRSAALPAQVRRADNDNKPMRLVR